MTLERIYARIPSAHCKGLCWEGCSYVPVFSGEPILAHTEPGHLAANPLKPGTVVMHDPGKDSCPHLVDRRCSRYEARPLACRMYGASIGLACEHGCSPDRWLSYQEGARLIEQAGKAAA